MWQVTDRTVIVDRESRQRVKASLRGSFLQNENVLRILSVHIRCLLEERDNSTRRYGEMGSASQKSTKIALVPSPLRIGKFVA